MANKDIKQEIKAAGLRQWQVSFELKIQDSNFSKMLRYELSDEKKSEIRSIISKLKRGDE